MPDRHVNYLDCGDYFTTTHIYVIFMLKTNIQLCTYMQLYVIIQLYKIYTSFMCLKTLTTFSHFLKNVDLSSLTYLSEQMGKYF